MEKIIYEIGNGEVITFKKPSKNLIIEDYVETNEFNKDVNTLEK